MKMVCFCEKVHFRFIYTPSCCKSTQKTAALIPKPKTFLLPLQPDKFNH